MEAEWLALIAAARLALDAGIAAPLLVGDAAAVIAQARGVARCPGAFVAHRDAFCAMTPPGGVWRIRHVRRTQNLAGIALAARHPR